MHGCKTSTCTNLTRLTWCAFARSATCGQGLASARSAAAPAASLFLLSVACRLTPIKKDTSPEDCKSLLKALNLRK